MIFNIFILFSNFFNQHKIHQRLREKFIIKFIFNSFLLPANLSDTENTNESTRNKEAHTEQMEVDESPRK